MPCDDISNKAYRSSIAYIHIVGVHFMFGGKTTHSPIYVVEFIANMGNTPLEVVAQHIKSF